MTVWQAVDALLIAAEDLSLPAVAARPDLHEWSPTPLPDFLEAMVGAEAHATGRRWLEVGSGIGRNLKLAQLLGWKPTGIEIRPEYIDQSRRYAPGVPVVECDALGFDHYGEFDAIFKFQPFKGADLESALDRVIASQIASSAVFVNMYAAPAGAWRPVASHVWRPR